MRKASWNPTGPSNQYHVTTSGLRDIAPDVLDQDGRLKIMPAAYYAALAPIERMWFCVRHGVYNLPTIEQVNYLRTIFDGHRVIEIGAGNGVLAKALGIIATDNYMQEREDVKELYLEHEQEPVRYGANVEKLDALAAIKKYSPHIVLACWLTHLYRPKYHERGGNEFAPDEKLILKGCKYFVFIGNTAAHRHHPLLNLRHMMSVEPGFCSRSVEGENFVGIWKGKKL